MSNYTEADVADDTRQLEVTVEAGNFPDMAQDRARIARLKSAALEGAKVPGIHAQLTALGVEEHSGFDETPPDWPLTLAQRIERLGAKVPGLVAAIESTTKQAEACFRASESASVEVSALNARVATLTADKEAVRSQLNRVHGHLVAIAKNLGITGALSGSEFETAALSISKERDALRAQVEAAHERARYDGDLVRRFREAAKTGGPLAGMRAAVWHAVFGDALSAPPAETKKPETCGMARYVQHDLGPDHRITPPCSFAPSHGGLHSWETPAETTPAPERAEELAIPAPAVVTCKGCGRPGVSTGRLDEVVCYRCWDPS